MLLFADVALRGAALDVAFLRAGNNFLPFEPICEASDAAHKFSVILCALGALHN